MKTLFCTLITLAVSTTWAINYSELQTKETMMESKGEIELETTYIHLPEQEYQNSIEAAYAPTDKTLVEISVLGKGNDSKKLTYEKASFEFIGNILSESESSEFGLGYLAEISLPMNDSDLVREFEGKLILDKNFGRLTPSLNIGFENETEKEENGEEETKTRPVYSAGLSYSLAKTVFHTNYNAVGGDENQQLISLGLKTQLYKKLQFGASYAYGLTNEVAKNTVVAQLECEF